MSVHTLYFPMGRLSRDEAAQWWQQYPALKTLLQFAQPVSVPHVDPLQRQAWWLHQPVPIPVAPITARQDLSEAFDPKAFYMRLDPVHLHPDRDTLVLFDAHEIDLQPEEAEALVSAFNAHFAEEGVQITAGASERWYMSLPQAIDIHTVSLPLARHANLHAVQPEGEAVRFWRRLINEAQMLFHMQPVNERRREKNLPEINGLWLWGEGFFPKNLKPRPELNVYGSEVFLQALAQSVSARLNDQKLPDTVEQWQANTAWYWNTAHFPEETVLNEWLSLLLAQLKNGAVRELVVDLGQQQAWHLTSAMLKRFWRRWKTPYWPEEKGSVSGEETGSA